MELQKLINDLVKDHYEYLSECEREKTNTMLLTARLKAKTYELEMYNEIAQKYFSIQMEERKRLFDSASAVLDKSMQTGDSEMASIAVRTIQVVQQKSPFSF